MEKIAKFLDSIDIQVFEEKANPPQQERVKASLQIDQKFIKPPNFGDSYQYGQYCHFYNIRLQQTYQNLIGSAYSKWPGVQISEIQVVEDSSQSQKFISAEQQNDLILVGLIFKHTKNRESLWKDFQVNVGIIEKGFKPPASHNIASSNDTLMLEDFKSQKQIFLRTEIDLLSGVACACLGNLEQDNKFYVKDIVFPQAKYNPRDMITIPAEQQKYIAILSGLQIDNEKFNKINYQMMINFFEGSLLRGTSQNISHLILVGDNVFVPDIANSYSRNSYRCQQFYPTLISDLKKRMNDFDNILFQLAAAIPIIVMPGEHDLTYQTIPQQPYSVKFFPKSSRYSTLQFTTNPASIKIDDLDILITSGQNIKSHARFVSLCEPIDIMDQQIQFRNIAPSAPDDLLSFPEFETDPFIIENQPHVYIAGNQENFSAKWSSDQKTKLITIPTFSTTGSLLLLNANTLDVQVISFS